jgi:hypothetical protein
MKKLTFAFLSIFLVLFSLQSANAQSTIGQAQAVFMYNFTRLIEWPAEYKSGDFIIGVYGSSEVYNEVKTFCSGKMVGSQPITVTKFSSADDIGKCHIVFVAYGKSKEIGAISSKISGNKTLIISERKGALEDGSAINFVVIDDKLKFELKASNGIKYGLKIHSNLESMAVAKY